MSSQPFIRLRCAAKPYPYGKKGSRSLAARFAAATPENNFRIDENQPYGEIWMGDHPSGAATTLDGTALKSLIESNPEEYLSPGVYERFNRGKHLPFLFKVLSLEKALPFLRAHPDRSLAEKLRRQATGEHETLVHPNQRPEVVVTLSEYFDGFVGFRPIAEIKSFLKVVPELRKVLSDHETVEAFLAAPEDAEGTSRLLKKMFLELLGTTRTEIVACSQQLLTHVERGESDALGGLGRQQGLARVIRETLSDYPEDVGVFAAVFFMNYIRLKKGEGIALHMDCIHAYLEGDVIECMAWSNNIIPHDFQHPAEQNDPKVFVDMLSYEASDSKKLRLQHGDWDKSGNGKTKIYYAPMDEFDLLNIKLNSGEKEVISNGIEGPTIFVVTQGAVVLSRCDGSQQEALEQGQVMFIKPGHGFQLEAVEGAEVWGSFVEA